MNKAEKFREVFGIYAEEFWAMSEKEMLEWIAEEAEPERKTGKCETVGFLTCQCSECGAQFHELEYTSFCPNCGVKWEVNDDKD
jgi:predicted Zn-ribbon and HTH transcriptional regulator